MHLESGPVREISVLIASANSEGSGEPAQMHSLARDFASRMHLIWVHMKALAKI